MVVSEASESVRQYLAEIGRKGGRANKGKCTDKAKRAAQIRWANYRKQKANENL